MQSSIKRLTGNAVEIEIEIPWEDISKNYEFIFLKLLDEVEVPGFRKGKAPRDLAEKQLNKTHVYEEVLKEIIPQAYANVVKQNNLVPILSPKVEVLEAQENKNWKMKITTVEKPIIKLGNYRAAIAKLKTDKKSKIWLPNEKKDEEKEEAPTLGEMFEVLLTEVSVELPDMIVEQEVNRMLSNLVDQTQKLGLTVEQYLQSQNKTSDVLRKEYIEQATKTLTLEFALEEIAEIEKVIVDPGDIDRFIKEAKSDAERSELAKQRYYIASLLRRQKTVASLLEAPVITT